MNFITILTTKNQQIFHTFLACDFLKKYISGFHKQLQ